MSQNVFGNMEEGRLVISLSGRIDTSNVEQAEKDIFSICEQYPSAKAVLNAKDLKYISSAGLRVLLKLRKQQGALQIEEVSSEIYEILEMTGFTEMMQVTKAFRHISLEGCEVIGRGGSAAVYRIDGDTIIKAYDKNISLKDIERERDFSRKAFVSGIPTAIPYDVVKCGECYGLVYELIGADTLASHIRREPEKFDEYMDKYTGLVKTLHQTHMESGALLDIKKLFCDRIHWMGEYLTEEERSQVLGLINLIPDRDTVIHGDLHTKNIMIQNGEAILIDMADIGTGHPIFDLLGIYLVLMKTDSVYAEKIGGLPQDVSRRAWDAFIQRYYGGIDEEKKKNVEAVCNVLADVKKLTTPLIIGDCPADYLKKIVSDSSSHLFPTMDENMRLIADFFKD